MFADESGSPVLDGADPSFPVFVLACVLVRKNAYSDQIVPLLQRMKFEFVGHDQLIFHERDIRRQQKSFAFLQTDAELRERFLAGVNAFVAAAPIEVFAGVIHKDRLKAKYAHPWSPYELSLYFCMERLLGRLRLSDQGGRLVHVVFESRGKKEDAELELTFRRIANNQQHWGYRRVDFSVVQWEPLFVPKSCNSSGLQLADLFARPIGLRHVAPEQANRAYEVIVRKFGPGGLKAFP